ncbi:hypothetical protein [Marinobacterium aestuariivivens]|uniref:hypothetical protein n=1 Tax=Marinobacterium aestuariivivens TaxID=1698799 RepID=UPI0036D3038F
MIKGYSKTRERGLRVFGVLSAAAERLRGQARGADILRQLKADALRSEDGSELVAGLRSSGLGELTAMVAPGPGSGGVQVMTPEAMAT